MANTYLLLPNVSGTNPPLITPWVLIRDDGTAQPFNLSVVGAFWNFTLATEAQIAFQTVYP